MEKIFSTTLTQHELVKKIGVSRATLHRVLIGSPLVKEDTRLRVQRELERLNYVPNAIAQGLKKRKTNTIGVIGPATANQSNVDKLTSIYEAARRRGYSIVFGFSDGTLESDADAIRELRSRMVEGIIAFARGFATAAPLYKNLVKNGIPFVGLYPTPSVTTDCVYVDTRQAFRKLTAHLAGLGHKKIGLLVTDSESAFTVNRILGFKDAMSAAGLSVREDWIVRSSAEVISRRHGEGREKQIWQTSDYHHGFWSASLLFARKERPTALVCLTDEAAVGALRAADLAGISVPGELALVGYNDQELAKYARVPLTTMHQPDELIGQEVISLLVRRISGGLSAKPVIKTLQARLIVRESCGASTKTFVP